MGFSFGKITETLKDLPGLTKNLPLDKIFTSDFMTKNTKFKTITDFLEKANITPDKLSNMLGGDGDTTVNKFVSENTNFSNLPDMVQKAMSLLPK